MKHQLNGHEFEQTQGDSEGRGSLACAVHGVTKSWTQLSNWTTTIKNVIRFSLLSLPDKMALYYYYDIPFFRWENLGSEPLSHLHENTQLGAEEPEGGWGLPGPISGLLTCTLACSHCGWKATHVPDLKETWFWEEGTNKARERENAVLPVKAIRKRKYKAWNSQWQLDARQAAHR